MDASKPFAQRGEKKQLEEGQDFSPKFDADGLIPAMAVDATSGEALMVALPSGNLA